MKIEITYWKGINLGPQRKEWMKNHLRLEEIDTESMSAKEFVLNKKEEMFEHRNIVIRYTENTVISMLEEFTSHMQQRQVKQIEAQPRDVEDELHCLLEQYQFKYKWYPDGESKFIMNQKFVNDIVRLFNPPNKQ